MNSFIIKGKLTEKEINLLTKDSSKFAHLCVPARVTGPKSYNPEARKSKIFFAKAKDYPTTFNILQSCIIQEYPHIYRYIDYSKITDIQYVKYNNGDFFKLHHDVINVPKNCDVRILSMSVNLTDQQKYEGGDLVVYNNKHKHKILTTLERERGSFVIFPSFFYHEVTKVTKGQREAIVTWLNDSELCYQEFRRNLTQRFKTLDR